ncbi:MAG: hypothetical protein AB1489_23795 [Acidobacteriota bacterium]
MIIMGFKHCTNGELITRLILPEQSLEEQQTTWCEFRDRFEHVIIGAICLVFRRYVSQLQFTPQDIYDLAAKIFFMLSQNNFQVLSHLSTQSDQEIETYLKMLASLKTLGHLNKKAKLIN